MRNIGHLVGRAGDGASAARPGARIANLSRVRSRVLSNRAVRCSTLVPSDDQPRLARCSAPPGSTERHHVGFGSWPCKNRTGGPNDRNDLACGSADTDQSPRIVSPVPNPLRLIAAMEEVGIVSVVCCARSRFGSNGRRVGCAPSAIVAPGAIIRAWIGPAADPPRSATVPSGPRAAMAAARMSGAGFSAPPTDHHSC